LIMQRIWAMPNRNTFTIKPIQELLAEELGPAERWLDPFAGWNNPAEFTNDLNPDAPVDYHMDALKFLKLWPDNFADGILFDPPYSITQASQCYKSFGKEKLEVNVANMGYWARVKNEMGRVIRPGGKAICFGWSSMGLGKTRGFRMRRVLLVPHGGSKNDTICTVEVKERGGVNDVSYAIGTTSGIQQKSLDKRPE
jgi:hypothetical protein